MLLCRGAPADRARAAALLATAADLAAAHGMVRLGALVADARKAGGLEPGPNDARTAHGGDSAPAVGPAPTADAPAMADDAGLFRREGEYWTIAHGGRTIRVRDVKGLHYVAYLLGAPGREVHVLDLLALTEGSAAAPAGAGGDELAVTRSADHAVRGSVDARARDAYRARMREVEEDLARAEADHDLGRAERARVERDLLREELSAAYGLGAAGRDAAGTATERARKAVYNRIRSATARLEGELPELARHLATALRTGTVCVYYPDRPVRWRIES
jgi:hypothetical protein